MDLVPVKKTGGLTRSQFELLANIPPEEEWLANIRNEKTKEGLSVRRAGVCFVFGIGQFRGPAIRDAHACHRPAHGSRGAQQKRQHGPPLAVVFTLFI
jgi:hypothetical protein